MVDAVIAELADMAATDPPGYPTFACEGSDWSVRWVDEDIIFTVPSCCFEVALAATAAAVEGDEGAFLFFFDALFGELAFLTVYAIACAALSAASLRDSSIHCLVSGHSLRNRPGGSFE